MFSRTAFSSAFRAAARPSRNPLTFARFAPLQIRLLSLETRTAIDQAVASAPVVLFMKGTPEMPQCGYSRASIQILGMQGVDPSKFTAFNVLEDNDLRAGIKEYSEWPTIPQLYLNKEFVGGCDILMSMHQDESSDFYRSTIINTTQDSLFATRRALIYRLTSTNGPGEQQHQQLPTTAVPSPPSNAFSFSPASHRASSPPNRLPTAAELQTAHNAAVAKVTVPFGDTPVVKGGGGKLGAGGGKEEKKADDALLAPDLHNEQPLSALMADFAAVVAREEKKLFELGTRWMQTQAEIRLLAEDIFGKEAVRDMIKGKNVDKEVAEVGRGLAEEEVEALKGMVDALVEETAKEAMAVREKERSVKRDQKKMILATVKRIEEL
ncbi:putative monothiol glutaredoxin-5 [Diplodia seriata]|uniref:Monothiol glutaredoxin-5, mitochondrial n=1 Tax=Diplodia seriata TaxID=420778 RepID=A0A0G2DUA7_9PEZI|nr:putative monothiol glutaredoxin-5 [Diplodia seriata]